MWSDGFMWSDGLTETMTINNVQSLTQSRQRDHDHAAEAGGFADALGVDVGAGF